MPGVLPGQAPISLYPGEDGGAQRDDGKKGGLSREMRSVSAIGSLGGDALAASGLLQTKAKTGAGQYIEMNTPSLGVNSYGMEKGYVMAMILHMLWVRLMGGNSRQMYNSISMLVPQMFNAQISSTML